MLVSESEDESHDEGSSSGDEDIEEMKDGTPL